MACGEFGPGRLAEPETIVQAILDALASSPAGAALQPLRGRRALVTAGPTLEPLDPVRVLTNRSSGKQGYAIAAALADLGAEVTLVSGPTALAAPAGVRRIEVETAVQMLDACRAALPADAAVFVAAVADWRPEAPEALKLKKKAAAAPPVLKLVENPDILALLSQPGPSRPRLTVGFAAETGDIEAKARDKLKRKGCDWIVANDVADSAVVGRDDNAVIVIDSQGADPWPRTAKTAVARRLALRIAEALA
jgi:phosphopantothenoylcysteine decarboxylase/phosphopantothenate--cysteine ligase